MATLTGPTFCLSYLNNTQRSFSLSYFNNTQRSFSLSYFNNTQRSFSIEYFHIHSILENLSRRNGRFERSLFDRFSRNPRVHRINGIDSQPTATITITIMAAAVSRLEERAFCTGSNNTIAVGQHFLFPPSRVPLLLLLLHLIVAPLTLSFLSFTSSS
ncbi:hypothetical protein PZA11_007327 [Diplocarpon coronariae]